jgi:hypothetical protein
VGDEVVAIRVGRLADRSMMRPGGDEPVIGSSAISSAGRQEAQWRS